ncbi:MAG: hypothetical protein EP329_02320 [Deltaproteobacteria bacterium]|nr:MAG: hypothetical protein EP329_02320 [Deltaproteobacteria bacterium]
MRLVLLTAAALLVALASASAQAAGPCETLEPEAKAVVDKVFATVHPHDCCDDTLDKCVAAEKPSKLVRRLADVICRRAAAGQEADKIIEAMQRRAVSMLGNGRPAKIETDGLQWAGAADAKVEIVAYVCTRCPYCIRWVPEVYKAVSEGGPLYGKARFAIRPFPLSSHSGAKEGGIAIEAARQLGAFWPYFLLVLERHNTFQADQLAAWSATVGLDPAAFQAKMEDPATEQAVVRSKKEGIRNGVQGTPTPFLDLKMYDGDLSLAAFVDAVLEEADRVDGTLCKP